MTTPKRTLSIHKRPELDANNMGPLSVKTSNMRSKNKKKKKKKKKKNPVKTCMSLLDVKVPNMESVFVRF